MKPFFTLIFFVLTLFSTADTIITKEGKKIPGTISEISNNQLLLKNNDKPIPLNTLQAIDFGLFFETFKKDYALNEYDLAAGAKHPRSLIIEKSTVFNLKSIASWDKSIMIKLWCNEFIDPEQLSPTILFHRRHDKITEVKTTIVTPDKKLIQLPSNCARISQSPYDDMHQLEIEFPQITAKSLILFELKTERRNNNRRSQFNYHLNFNSTLYTKYEELIVYSQSSAPIPVDYYTSSSNVKYLRANIDDKIQQKWWLEDIDPTLDVELDLIVVTDTQTLFEEAKDYLDNFNNVVKSYRRSGAVSINKATIKDVVTRFRQNYQTRPTFEAFTPQIPIRPKSFGAGSAVNLAPILFNELTRAGHSPKLFLAKAMPNSPVQEVDTLRTFNNPVIVVDQTDIFLNPNLPPGVYDAISINAESLGVASQFTIKDQRKYMAIPNVELLINKDGLYDLHFTPKAEDLNALKSLITIDFPNFKIEQSLNSIIVKNYAVFAKGDDSLLTFFTPKLSELFKALSPKSAVTIQLKVLKDLGPLHLPDDQEGLQLNYSETGVEVSIKESVKPDKIIFHNKKKESYWFE